MSKQVIVLTHGEHANAMGAIGEYNGLNVDEVGVYKDGELVAYDEVRLVVDGLNLKVRSMPERDNTMRDLLKERMERFLKYGPDMNSNIPGVADGEEEPG